MKTILHLPLLAIAMVAFNGCQQTQPVTPDPAPPMPLIGGKFANAPMWVANPSIEGGLSAVGSAMPTQAGMAFQRTRALANGRDELARQLSLEVTNLFKDFAQVTGVGDAETVDTVASSVSRQVAQATLAGSRQADMWQANDGELYVLVVMEPESVINATKEAVKAAVSTSLGNDQALYQQFLGERAQADLDSALDKRFGKK
jgi:hypothetical protein